MPMGMESSILTWLILLMIPLLLLYIWSQKKRSELARKTGLSGPTPLPFVGTFYQILFRGRLQTDLDNIKKYGKIHFSSMDGQVVVIVADTDMMKQVFVKKFEYFTNRRKLTTLLDKPVNKMMTMVDDDEWRNIRQATSAAFSGAKLRKMANDIHECADIYVRNLKSLASKQESFDVKIFNRAFAGDIIARVAFGVDIDSQNDPDHPFVRHITDILDYRFLKKPLLMMALFFPVFAPVFKKLGCSFISKDASTYFTSLVENTIAARKGAGVGRNDYLQLMVDAMGPTNYEKEGIRKPLTFDDVLSNCIGFFFAGFSTVGDTISYSLYSMAKYPEMQEKLYNEILYVLDNRKICTYEDMKAMPYLDMFLREVLRMHSPVLLSERVCSQDVVIDGVKFPKDCIVGIPFQAVHFDPDYWPNPEKFDPERFAPVWKNDLEPVHWLPFGFGPRNCVAIRLALVEIKMGLIQLVRNFRFQLMEPGQQLERNALFGAANDFQLKFICR